MNTAGDDGGLNGNDARGGLCHPRRAHERFADLCGWHQHGVGGSSGGGGQMPQVAAAQEVVMTISGGLAEAETSGLSSTPSRAKGSNTFTGQFNFSGSNDSLQGSNYTQALQDAGLRAPFELINVYDVSGIRRPDRAGQAVVLRRLPPGRGRADGAGHVLEQERRQPEFLDGGLRSIQAGLQQQPGAPGDDPADVAGDAAQQVQFPLVRAVQRRQLRHRGVAPGCRTTTPEASSRVLYIPSRQPHATWQSPISGTLLAEAGWGMYQARYRFGMRNDGHVQPGDDPAAGADR